MAQTVGASATQQEHFAVSTHEAALGSCVRKKKTKRRQTNLVRKIPSLRCSLQLGAYPVQKEALSQSGFWSLSAEVIDLRRILSPFLGEGATEASPYVEMVP